MKKPKSAIGMVVMSMAGKLQNEFSDYFDVANILKNWEENKLYYATKKNYLFLSKMTMFGESKRDIIDNWLDQGYSIEKQFREIKKRLEFTARH